MKKSSASFLISILLMSAFLSCKKENSEIENLISSLNDETIDSRTKFGILLRLSSDLKAEDPDSMTIFLTDWVENNPDDDYNAVWLYQVAAEYLKKNSEPVAEYYFERVLRNYPDLLIDGKSVHLACLQNLIKISKNARNRIQYYNMLINSFSDRINATELYIRLAIEYEKEGEWENALRSYSLFLAQADASTIQIKGLPDAYSNARKMVDFANSPKNWTFESLGALEKSVKAAITEYSWQKLDSFRSKSNFFMMSWKTSAEESNTQAEFSMKKFMRGNKIRYNAQLDESSNPNEAYLRTSGWNTYVGTWYLYFRKVNFPIDPEIHGRWEWAGIYLGEKL